MLNDYLSPEERLRSQLAQARADLAQLKASISAAIPTSQELASIQHRANVSQPFTLTEQADLADDANRLLAAVRQINNILLLEDSKRLLALADRIL